MLEEQFTKAATGLAIIIPAIFLLKWLLRRKIGSPEEWAEEQIKELELRHARGDIDQETLKQRVAELRDEN